MSNSSQMIQQVQKIGTRLLALQGIILDCEHSGLVQSIQLHFFGRKGKKKKVCSMQG